MTNSYGFDTDVMYNDFEVFLWNNFYAMERDRGLRPYTASEYSLLINPKVFHKDIHELISKVVNKLMNSREDTKRYLHDHEDEIADYCKKRAYEYYQSYVYVRCLPKDGIGKYGCFLCPHMDYMNSLLKHFYGQDITLKGEGYQYKMMLNNKCVGEVNLTPLHSS